MGKGGGEEGGKKTKEPKHNNQTRINVPTCFSNLSHYLGTVAIIIRGRYKL